MSHRTINNDEDGDNTSVHSNDTVIPGQNDRPENRRETDGNDDLDSEMDRLRKEEELNRRVREQKKEMIRRLTERKREDTRRINEELEGLTQEWENFNITNTKYPFRPVTPEVNTPSNTRINFEPEYPPPKYETGGNPNYRREGWKTPVYEPRKNHHTEWGPTTPGHQTQISRIKAIDPPKFSGQLEDAAEWLERFELICDTNAWTEEIKVRQMLQCMESGAAYNWYIANVARREPKPMWEWVKTSFRQTFLPPNLQHSIYRELYGKPQAFGETPLEYALRVQKLTSGMGQWAQQEIIGIIRTGLRDETFSDALTNVYTVAEAIKAITVKESHFSFKRKQERQQNRPVDNNQTNANYIPNDNSRFNQNNGNRYDSNFRGGFRGRGGYSGQQNSTERGYRVQCYNCDEYGHNRFQCEQPRDWDRIEQRQREHNERRPEELRGTDENITINSTERTAI